MAPGIRPIVNKPKKEEETSNASRIRSISPRMRSPSATPSTVPSSKPSPKSSSSSESDYTVDLPSPSSERKVSPNRSLERKSSPGLSTLDKKSSMSVHGSMERISSTGDNNKSFIKLKSSFDAMAKRFEEMSQANARMEEKIQELESQQRHQDVKTAEIVTAQVKALLKRVVTLEKSMSKLEGKDIVLSDHHSHYAMTDERSPTSSKPSLSSSQQQGKNIMLSDHHSHYAMTDERSPTSPKPALNSGKAKKGMMSRLGGMARSTSNKETTALSVDAEGQPPQDVILLTKPKSVIQIRAEKYEQQKTKLSEAIADDREEWEKRADGDTHAIQTQETLDQAADLPLTLREKIALRRGSTRDVKAVQQLNKTGRLSALGVSSVEEEEGGGGSTMVVEEPIVVAQTLELSEEEKAMNGAPEGKLFVVEVLPREQVRILIVCRCVLCHDVLYVVVQLYIPISMM
jgi:hypothetical protein